MSDQMDDGPVQVVTTGNGEAVASTDVRHGYLSGPGFTDAPVTYSVVEGIAVYDGCIDMGPVDDVERYTAEFEADDTRGIGVPPDSAFLWPNGVVPFVIDPALPDPARVTNAISHFHQRTGIRFRQRTTEPNFIRFVSNGNLDFSSSPIGMRGGEQIVRISNGSGVGVIIHECCHSLGMLHEQSRCDRDSFVTINLNNVRPGTVDNFNRFCQGFRDYFEYDFGSIMHYGATAFSVNNQPTIVPKTPGTAIGQRQGLSFVDRMTLAEMYRRFDPTVHHGVWRAGTDGHALWVNATWEDFVAKWQEWAAQGLRLVDVNVRNTGAGLRYSGVWRAGTGGYALWGNATWDSFVTKWQEWGGQGLRLVDLAVVRVGNELRFTGAWLPGTEGYALWGHATWESLVTKWQEWAGQGLRLVDVNAVQVGGQTRYFGVWLPGNGGYGLWGNASRDSFISKWQEWSGQGLRLADLSTHRAADGQILWTGAFLPGTEAHYLWVDAPWEGFRARWEQLSQQGMRLVDYENLDPTAPSLTGDMTRDQSGEQTGELDGAALEPGGGAWLPEPAVALDQVSAARPAAAGQNGSAGPVGEGGLVLDPAAEIAVTVSDRESSDGEAQDGEGSGGIGGIDAGSRPDAGSDTGTRLMPFSGNDEDGTGQGFVVLPAPQTVAHADGPVLIG
jgi:hypothetical protein